MKNSEIINCTQEIVMDIVERYITSERREEVLSFLDWLNEETNYFFCPASARYHNCFPGGLVFHSAQVFEWMLKLRPIFYPEVSEETCAIVALFHDVGKVGWNKNFPYYKTVGRKTYYATSNVNFSIGTLTIYHVGKFLTLTQEELQAIAAHDGLYLPGNEKYWKSSFISKLTVLTHYADFWCSRFEEERGR